MKKKYISPTTMVIPLRTRTPRLLTASENEYSNNQGHVHFESDKVSAEDSD